MIFIFFFIDFNFQILKLAQITLKIKQKVSPQNTLFWWTAISFYILFPNEVILNHVKESLGKTW